MTSVVRSSHRIDVAEQKVRTPHCKPYDIRSFKADLLLVLDGVNGTVSSLQNRDNNWDLPEYSKASLRWEACLHMHWHQPNVAGCHQCSNERSVSAAVFVNQSDKAVKCYGREDNQRPLLYSRSICKGHIGLVVILDGLNAEVHLVNKNGIFQMSSCTTSTLSL